MIAAIYHSKYYQIPYFITGFIYYWQSISVYDTFRDSKRSKNEHLQNAWQVRQKPNHYARMQTIICKNRCNSLQNFSSFLQEAKIPVWSTGIFVLQTVLNLLECLGYGKKRRQAQTNRAREWRVWWAYILHKQEHSEHPRKAFSQEVQQKASEARGIHRDQEKPWPQRS